MGGRYVSKRPKRPTGALSRGLSKPMSRRMSKRSFGNRSASSLTVNATVIGPSLTADPLGTSPAWNYSSFDLSNIPDWAAYQQLYDQVRLNKITVKFYPNQTGLDAGTFQSQKQQDAAFIVAAIPDNTLTLNTMSAITQIGAHKRGSISQPMTISFTPKMLVNKQVRATAGFTQTLVIPENDWLMLSTSSSQVSFHGLYTLFDTWSFVAPAVGTPIPGMRTEVIYNLTFRTRL